MARARVELILGASYRCSGRPSFTKRQVRYLTNDHDIAYFEAQSDFKVVRLIEEPIARPIVKEEVVEQVVEQVVEEPKELPAWTPTSKKSILHAAAKARDIAYTAEDTNAELVELLQMWDD